MNVMKLSLSGNLSNLRSQSTRRAPRRELPSYGRLKRLSPSRIDVTDNPCMGIARQGAERSFVQLSAL